MTDVVFSDERKLSNSSSEFSDLLPPCDDVEERIKDIRNAIEKSEISNKVRKKYFRVRLNYCKDRIDTLEEKRIGRLGEEGIIIDFEKLKKEAAKAAKKDKELVLRRRRTSLIEHYKEFSRNTPKKPAPETVEINDWPTDRKEDLVGLSGGQLVLSVKDELAKLNLTSKSQKGKQGKRTAPKIKVQEPIVLPIVKKDKSARGSSEKGRRSSLQPDQYELPIPHGERRGSLSLMMQEERSGSMSGGRRKSVATTDRKYHDRRNSTLAEQHQLPGIKNGDTGNRKPTSNDKKRPK